MTGNNFEWPRNRVRNKLGIKNCVAHLITQYSIMSNHLMESALTSRTVPKSILLRQYVARTLGRTYTDQHQIS